MGRRRDIVVSHPGESSLGTIRVGNLGQSGAREKICDRECSEDGHLREKEGGGTRGKSVLKPGVVCEAQPDAHSVKSRDEGKD